MKAVVLAAEKATNMKSNKALVLHELMGYPLIKYTLNTIRAAGINDITIVVGYQAEEVKKVAGDGYNFVVQEPQMGSGHALLTYLNTLKDMDTDLLVMGGATPLISPDAIRSLLEYHLNSGADCTILTGFMDASANYGRIYRDDNQKIVKVSEYADKDKSATGTKEVNSGTFVFKASKIFEALKYTRENENQQICLADAIDLMIATGKTVCAYQTQDPQHILKIDTWVDIITASTYLKLILISQHIANGVAIVDPATTYIEPDVKIGRDTLINPFTVIRKNVRIGENCVIGPFAHIRSGTVIEYGAKIGNFVEVKNTKIGKKSKSMHLSYLGDAIIGNGVNIGAGTITANFDGIKKNTTIIEDDVFTGCNSVLVAPVTIGKGAIVGACAVVTKGKNVAPGDVVAGVPARSIKHKIKEREK